MSRTFQILVVGDAGVGKTVYLNRLLTGEFERNYNQTERITGHRMSNMTSNSRDRMICIDVPGKDDTFHHMEKYENTTGAIIMADRTSRITILNVKDYYGKLRQDYPDIPIVICLNKMDIRDSSKDYNNNFRYGVPLTDKKVQFCKISAKSNLNFDRPFNILLPNMGSSHTSFEETRRSELLDRDSGRCACSTLK
jgi:GTP-binding nuclear protein Ran